MKRLERHADLRAPAECWAWLGHLDKDGYGGVKHGGKWRRAHRVAYERAHGPIPDGLEIDHLCRNRACVNPAHLEAVTRQVNVARSRSAHGEQTHCKNGHEFDEANTYRTGGRRDCRTCGRARVAAYKARRKAVA